MSEQEEKNAEWISKDGKRRPVKALYQHITGSIWMVWGTAIDFKTKESEIVVLAGVDKDTLGMIVYWPLDTFFDIAPERNANGQPNPKAGTQRFQLITPA